MSRSLGADMGEQWVPTDEFFGARLALVRQKMGWGNVKEAALACGLPQESWRSWERDNRKPRDFQAICEKIAGRAGCDLFWLMTGHGRPNRRRDDDPNGGLRRSTDITQGTCPDNPDYRPAALAA